MHSTQFGSFLFLSFLTISHELKCYEGSKGEIKGETTKTFVEQQCEEGMQYCFESFNYDQTEVTAQCQLRSTDQKLLDICKVGCVNHTDVRIVICCCDQDLCNTSPYNFTTPDVEDEETTTVLTTSTGPDEPKVKREDGVQDENGQQGTELPESNEADKTVTTLNSEDEDSTGETYHPQSKEARKVRRLRRR